MNFFLEGLKIEDLKQLIEQSVHSAMGKIEPIQVLKLKFYSRQELAKLLGVHVNTIDNLRRSGKLNFSQFGRTLRISETEVQEFLDNQKNAI